MIPTTENAGAEVAGDSRQAVQAVQFSIILVTGVVLSLSFIFLLLIIVNSPAATQSALSEGGQWVRTFLTRRSLFVYETALAGMLGAYIGELSQIGALKTETELRAYGQRFFVALFLGGAAAIVVGVLFPLVVLGDFEGDKINSWTLVAASGIAGNRARDAFSQVEGVIRRLLADFEPTIDSVAISNSVKAGVQEAFAVPPPIRYEGLAAADVLRNNESVIDVETGRATLALGYGTEFELTVRFVPSQSQLGAYFRGLFKTISIRDGSSQSAVPFRLLVDLDFGSPPLAERSLLVPVNAVSSLETFTFNVPISESQAQIPAEDQGQEQSPRREIVVSIYQHTRYFDAIVIPVELRT